MSSKARLRTFKTIVPFPMLFRPMCFQMPRQSPLLEPFITKVTRDKICRSIVMGP